MYRVSKEIHFCYGHRLLDYDGKCAHPHGHNGKIVVELETPSLDKRGMVVDFTDIKELLQKWVDSELDHKMILRKDDELVKVLGQMKEPVFVMEQNPTAENLAKLIFDFARSKKLPIRQVTFWETPSSSTSFSG